MNERDPLEISAGLYFFKIILSSSTNISRGSRSFTSKLRRNSIGKKVMVLVNLKPAKLAGVLSEGMLLCAENDKGELALVTPDKDMPAGAEIC